MDHCEWLYELMEDHQDEVVTSSSAKDMATNDTLTVKICPPPCGSLVAASSKDDDITASWPSSTEVEHESCVPAEAMWVTLVDPPRREKRQRKNSRPPPKASSHATVRAASTVPVATTEPCDGYTSRDSCTSRSSQDEQPETPGVVTPPTEEMAELAPMYDPEDVQKRNLRHNLTERRRVDRLNQRFKNLFLVLQDACPPEPESLAVEAERLSVLGADGKPINPNKWSKADVLEGALNLIQDLRKQLVEERLSQTLGMINTTEYTVDADELALSEVPTFGSASGCNELQTSESASETESK